MRFENQCVYARFRAADYCEAGPAISRAGAVFRRDGNRLGRFIPSHGHPLAHVIISQRKYRSFRGLRSGAYAVCVSPVSRACIATPLSEQLSHVDVAEADPHRAVDEAVDHGVGLDAAA